MSLSPGTRLGPYEVAALIGVGGMGEVYRALDTNLKRDVALKILPDNLVDDPTRLARLQREAELLAALNHPNVAHIYGLERSGETIALVMELVEGTSLAERIREGAVPVREALALALQIAAALEAAHERGIIHRDLKPDNVRLTTDGTVKVLDFGIAKALDPQGATGPRAPALTTPAMTEVGLVLGTAAYMSPEQARGKPLDKRADIWAFGCVLYEMLAGRPVFLADDVTTTLARVLERDPDLTALPAGTPAAVRRTLELCLKKDPKERLADIRDVRLALGGAFEVGGGAATRAPQNRRRQIAQIAVAAIVAAGLTALAAVALRPAPPPAPTVSRFLLALPNGARLQVPQLRMLDISRDGQSIVLNTSSGLYVRSLGELQGRVIGSTNVAAAQPFFSPDGASVGFLRAGGEITRMSVAGSNSTTIGQFSNVYLPTFSWSLDGTILYGRPEGVFRIPANGGTPELVVRAHDAEQIYAPQLLPDGDSVLFTTLAAPSSSSGDIAVASLATGTRKTIASGIDARYVASGHIVYVAGNALFAAPFDARRLSITGSAVPVVQDLMLGSGIGQYAVADNGTLVYVRGRSVATFNQMTLSWVTRDGREEPVGVAPGGYDFVRVSHDGRRIALSATDSGGNVDIWTADVGRPVLSRITTSPATETWPMWSPDDRNLVFSSEQTPGIAWTAADGTGAIEPLVTMKAGLIVPGSWTPDGKAFVFTHGGGTAQPKIGLLTIEPDSAGERKWTELIDRATGASAVNISPNGEWIAYHTDDTGQYGVYIERFPKLGDRHLISDQRGGWGAIWSKAGDEVFYRRLGDGAMMSVPIQTSPTVTIGAPRLLFESRGAFLPPSTPVPGGGSARSWDLAPDGRFLMIKLPSIEDDSSDIVVVENWFEELKRLAPARK
jgi:serine/threonine-protein kinase